MLSIDKSFFSIIVGIVCEKLDDLNIRFKEFFSWNFGDNHDIFESFGLRFHSFCFLPLSIRWENFSHLLLKTPLKIINRIMWYSKWYSSGMFNKWQKFWYRFFHRNYLFFYIVSTNLVFYQTIYQEDYANVSIAVLHPFFPYLSKIADMNVSFETWFNGNFTIDFLIRLKV